MRSTRLASLLGLVALVAAPARAQSGAAVNVPRDRAVLAGRVRDAAGHPITAAVIRADDQDRVTIVDDSGTFRIKGLFPGASRFTASRVGYEAMSFVLDLPADSTIFIDIHLRHIAITALRNVTQSGQTVRSYSDVRLNATGWGDRRRTLLGYFIEPDQIARERHARVAQYLIGIPGVSVRGQPGGGDLVTFVLGQPCEPRLYVDGQPVQVPIDSAMTASDLFAIEVYPTPSMVPEKFATPTKEQACGVVALWSRRYEP